MKEIIEVLNETSPLRVIFYSLVFLIALYLTTEGVRLIVKQIVSNKNTRLKRKIKALKKEYLKDKYI